MGRIIGIRHRVKRTAEGEARPTQIVIKDGYALEYHDLDDETAELDFVCGRFPIEYRQTREGENLTEFQSHHIKTQKKKESDERTLKVPSKYDGLQDGDIAVMALGGSGDRLAYALSRRGDRIGAKVLRIPPSTLKETRENLGEIKEDDAKTLISLFESSRNLFYELTPRDRDLIKVSESLRARRDAQKDRIACEQRLRQRFIGRIFLSDSGYYPEGSIEDEYDKMKATDIILRNLIGEEKEREKELRKAVNELNVWHAIFSPIKGCGEVIAAGIIAPIGNIMRFKSDGALKKFAGVHVLEDGRFARKRMGSTANWNPQLRQALYLLGDQFNRHPDSVWGQKLREYKVKFREKHPEVVENGKKKYSKAHIHKMATWRTLTKFVEWLHKEWTRIERETGG
ncbi:hypothetical protein EPN15_05275 [Patescibacteria group bacterium]|nr:MAG: hypothetical protein EPN15_05275 [Patescibacteria group bacterium]